MQNIKIAVIGLAQSGKSALTSALQKLADKVAHDLQFTEVHNPDELHGHSYDVVLQVVDSTRLEESLLLTPHIIDEHEKINRPLAGYPENAATHRCTHLPCLRAEELWSGGVPDVDRRHSG